VTSTALIDLASRLIDRFRPARSLGGQEVFQFRFLVGSALLGLTVSVLSLAVAITTGPMLNGIVIALFGVGLLVTLIGVRAGLSIPVLSWFCLFLLGGFLLADSLITAEFHESQLRWLVLLPMVSVVLAEVRPSPGRLTPPARVVGLAALLAILLGAAIVIAHGLGWTGGLPEPPSTAAGLMAGSLVDYGLFIVSVTGLLWISQVALRKSEEELHLLRRILSVCAWCKRIHDAEDGWIPMEQHLAKSKATSLSHGICPDCAQSEFPEEVEGR
jgi:hypothetical protein